MQLLPQVHCGLPKQRSVYCLKEKMQSNSSMGDDGCILQPEDQGHRSVCPDELLKTDETSSQNNEVERVNCECCGMAEDCTPSYISQIRENYCGKWLCGLCMEAVREKQRKYREFTIEQALEAHTAICKQFNSNTRVNPKLSLADAMINFARRRSQLRDAGRASGAPTRPARTSSCGPWLGVNTRSNK